MDLKRQLAELRPQFLRSYTIIALELVGHPEAAEEFKRTFRLPILAPTELYGSKLVAAMNRQHPRDWFDCLLLRQNEGLTADIRQTFVADVAATTALSTKS